MKSSKELQSFAPLFAPDHYSEEDCWHVSPFFTNLDQSVYVPLIFSPELAGALCSRTSRAAGDLRQIYLREFIYPFVRPERGAKETDGEWSEKQRHGASLKAFIAFLHEHPVIELFSNPRARSFYVKWLAQYGDDSIAQMAGTHLVFTGITQLAIKHLEDQRIGLAPLEKSTRYVNYADRINDQYLYYRDPTLHDLGLAETYREAMDNLFDTYSVLMPKLEEWFKKRFPEERASVIEKKAFDTLRGLLPIATLSQAAFFGNGQSFEYMVNRAASHPLGELRWIASRTLEEMERVTPSFFRRVREEAAETYQAYIGTRSERASSTALETIGSVPISTPGTVDVQLVEYDPEGETKIIASIFYAASRMHASWNELLTKARRLTAEEKRRVISRYLEGRTARWQKIGRAFENVYLRFEITMDIGGWRDLQRHRMLTQMRQDFSCNHGFQIPQELEEAGLSGVFCSAVRQAEDAYSAIARENPALAQYAVTLSHRIRFMQWQNLRSLFWTAELRTIPEGHPDYRHIEQQKFRLVEKVYPLIAEHMLVNLGEYDFARRGQEERIQKKLETLSQP